MRRISLRNDPFLWTSTLFFLSLFSRCVSLNKTVKRDPYVSYATPTGYATSIDIYIYIHLLRIVWLMWLTSRILTPDALFALLNLCISYASYSILYLLIIQMTFFSLSITRGKVWLKKDISSYRKSYLFCFLLLNLLT
jgi:hypothetical protein